MPTAQLIGGPGGLPGEPVAVAETRSGSAVGLPAVIGIALLALILYAAFDHGAVALPADTRLQVAIAAIAAVAGAGWLWSGTLRLWAPRSAVVGTVLLAAFACWSGITVLWSVAPDQTWIELNRAIAYVIVLCLAIAVGASLARAGELVAKGFVAIALAVSAYALGQKLLPGVHLAGVFDLNQTGSLPRLQEPLGYWNALALFIALGVPVALALAVDSTRRARSRLAAACAVELMLLTIALTYSRGGLLALALALVVGIAAGGERLRSLLWLSVAVIAAVPPIVLGLSSHSLTAAGVSLSSREGAGGLLALVLVASLAGLLAAGRVLLVLDRRLALDPGRARALRRLGLAAVTVLVLGAVAAVSLSSRGPGGTVSHAWNSFTSTRAASNSNPSRLLSADSENRWVWWKEAAGAFSDRPLGGWGAGSFGVVHLLYRRDTLPVQQPHSVPLQFLAETGVVGALLGIGAIVLLLSAAGRAIRSRAQGTERLLAAALLAGAVAYAVHCLYDWDWNIPAVTLPALVFLGVLIGARSGASGGARGPRSARSRSLERPSLGSRALGLGALTLWLCVFALSALLPSLAASKADSALIQAASGSPGALRSAQASASLASSLDPLSDAGLRAEASVAIHQGRLARARAELQQAVGRDPTDGLAWNALALVYGLLRDTGSATFALQRMVALDPRAQSAQAIARYELSSAPPGESVTATRTPPPAK
jgi:hypothetical protein